MPNSSDRLEQALTAAIELLADAASEARAFSSFIQETEPLLSYFLMGAGVGLHGADAEQYGATWLVEIASRIRDARPPYRHWLESQFERLIDREFFFDAVSLQTRIFCHVQKGGAGLEIHSVIRPCQRVTGDSILVIPSAQWTDFVLADMTSHGTAAGLAGSLAAWLLEKALQRERSLAESLHAAHCELESLTRVCSSLPASVLRWHRARGRVEVVNCGSVSPIVRLRGSAATHVEAGGRPLGLLSNPEFEIWEEDVQPGDVWILSSDGFVEQENSGGLDFGSEGVSRAAIRAAEKSAEQIAAAILDAVDEFAGTQRQGDDQSLLVLKF